MTPLTGFLFMAGVLTPHFGRSIDIGIHNRVLGWFLLLGAVLTAIPSFRSSRANTRDLLIALALLATLLAYSTGDQLSELFHVPSRFRYFEEKTAVTLQVCLPVILSAWIVSSLRHDPSFHAGLRAGAITAGAVALAYIAFNRDYFLFQSPELKVDLSENLAFATIGFSVILCSAAIALLSRLHTVPLPVAIASVAAIVVLIAAVVVVQQRTHLLVVALIACVTITSALIRPATRPRALLLVAGFTLAAVAAASFREQILGPMVLSHWDQLGDASAIRLDALSFAFQGFLARPLGAGVGSFSTDYPNLLLYPHNVLAEACYELGIIGAVIILAVLASCLWRFVRSWAVPSFIAGLSLFAALHFLKAADLSGTDLLWVALILSRPCLPIALPSKSALKTPSSVYQRLPAFQRTTSSRLFTSAPFVSRHPRTIRAIDGFSSRTWRR